MNYGDWLYNRSEWLRIYPRQDEHFRLDIELKGPYNSIQDIPVDFNPHIATSDSRRLYYLCSDWSTIWNICNLDTEHGPRIRMLVECSHQHPWGEQITLMSTAHSIIHEWWADRQNWHDFALWRGQYWKLTWNECLSPFPFGRGGLPYSDPERRDSYGHETYAFGRNLSRDIRRLMPSWYRDNWNNWSNEIDRQILADLALNSHELELVQPIPAPEWQVLDTSETALEYIQSLKKGTT